LASFNSEIQDEISGLVTWTEETKNAYVLLVGNFKFHIHKLIFNTIRKINISSYTTLIGLHGSTESNH
jgi:hypothetical protein